MWRSSGPSTAQAPGSVVRPLEQARQHEPADHRQTDCQARALAHELLGVLAQFGEVLGLEPAGRPVDRLSCAARVVAIFEAELLVDRRGIVADDLRQALERLGRLRL